MKLLYAFAILLLISCSKKDSISQDIPTEGLINLTTGKWSVTYLSPGLAQSQSYQLNDILWKFNSNKELIVEINTDLTNKYTPILDAGKYTFELKDNKILLDNQEYDYTIVDDELTISDHPEVDGPQMGFVRVR